MDFTGREKDVEHLRAIKLCRFFIGGLQLAAGRDIYFYICRAGGGTHSKGKIGLLFHLVSS